MDVDVVIVTYNSEDHIGDAVRSLLACPQIGSIIVVDNASTDASARLGREAGAHRVIMNLTNAGFAAAVNRGLAEVSGDRVLLFNPDARIDATTLSALEAALDETPQRVVAAPVLVGDDGVVTTGAARFVGAPTRVAQCLPLVGRLPVFSTQYSTSRLRLQTGVVTPVDSVWGAVMLVDTDFLREMGGLDERFFLFFEDEDLCRRAHATGRSVVLVGGAPARHAGGASSTDAALREARRLFAAWQLVEKWQTRAKADGFRRGVKFAFRLRAAALDTAALTASLFRSRAGAVDFRRRARDVVRTLTLLDAMFEQGRAS